MITIGIDPILISLGSFSLSWHSLFMAIAIVVGVWLPAYLVAKAGLSVDRLYPLALWGGILGGTIVAVIFARIRAFPLARYADLAALGLLLAQAIGRIGDVINGEHISKGTSLLWGVVYTHPDSPSYGLPPSHPAVGYELLMIS